MGASHLPGNEAGVIAPHDAGAYDPDPDTHPCSLLRDVSAIPSAFGPVVSRPVDSGSPLGLSAINQGKKRAKLLKY
jgi:hypothetical protein